MADSYDVFGVGNALVDILALVDDEFVSEREIAKASMTLVDPAKQGALLNDLEGSNLKLRSGGSAANTMIAIAQSGGTGFYVGKVAKDSHGEFYKQDLEEAGVRFDVNPATGEGPTGTCLVLTTPDAERTMCTNLGVSVELEPADIDLGPLGGSKISYIEGYLWTGDQTRAAGTLAMEQSKANGVKVAFTFSDMFLVDLFRADFLRIAEELCDIIFCNADEVRHLFELTSLEECCQKLGALVETAFVTDGPNGSYVVHKGKLQHVEGFEAKAVDTVGAGDAFAGGVLYGLTNGMDCADAARWGNYVASRVVQIYGARLEDPIANQVDKVLGR